MEEDEEIKTELDWKAAGRKLKQNVDTIRSIDNYFRKDLIAALRERYNSKERTQDLYYEIMAL